MFSSLRIRNYRLFFLGQVVSNTGTWMQRIAQDWLVLSLTGSSAAVGITTALQFLPMLLFGLYGGVLVDRLPKRPTLLATQTAMGVTGLALAFLLTLSGHVQVWHVLPGGLRRRPRHGCRQPRPPVLRLRDGRPGQLQNAVSHSANFQSARLVGPAVAGVLITGVGTGWAFLFNGLSFVAPIVGLLLMRARDLHPVERAPRGKGQLREGLHYVAGHPELIWPIVLVGFIGTFGFNFPVWLSAYADDIFHAGAGGYSLFNTLMAVGSVAGALLAACCGTARLRILIAAAMAFGILEVAAALAPSFWLFALLMVPIGIFGLTVNVTANTAVQMGTDLAMRGRVMALFMMVFMVVRPWGRPWSAGSPTPTAPGSASPSAAWSRPSPRPPSAWSWPGSAACACRWAGIAATRRSASYRGKRRAAGAAGHGGVTTAALRVAPATAVRRSLGRRHGAKVVR